VIRLSAGAISLQHGRPTRAHIAACTLVAIGTVVFGMSGRRTV
jgi:hypothetical protein